MSTQERRIQTNNSCFMRRSSQPIELPFEDLTLDFIWLSRNKLIYEALQRDPREAILQLKINLDSHLSAWHVAALPSLPSRMGCMKGNFDVASRNNFTTTAAVISDSSRNIILATRGVNEPSLSELSLFGFGLFKFYSSSSSSRA
jgi:hypothetical protein